MDFDCLEVASGTNIKTNVWLKISPCQPSEDVLDIRVVASRFGNSNAQLSVAECTDRCYNTCDDPYDEGQAHWTGIFQHSLWADKDSRANNITCKRKKNKEVEKTERIGAVMSLYKLYIVLSQVDIHLNEIDFILSEDLKRF